MFVLEHQIYVLYMIDMKTLPVEFVSVDASFDSNIISVNPNYY